MRTLWEAACCADLHSGSARWGKTRIKPRQSRTFAPLFASFCRWVANGFFVEYTCPSRNVLGCCCAVAVVASEKDVAVVAPSLIPPLALRHVKICPWGRPPPYSQSPSIFSWTWTAIMRATYRWQCWVFLSVGQFQVLDLFPFNALLRQRNWETCLLLNNKRTVFEQKVLAL